MMKQRLFTPGPTDVPPEVLNEMAKPIVHHRTPRFKEMLRRMKEEMSRRPGRLSPLGPPSHTSIAS